MRANMTGTGLVLVEAANQKWQWFASLTVRERSIHPLRLQRRLDSWLGRVAGGQGLAPSCLLTATRIETGLDPAHVHAHVLIGGLRRVGASARFVAMHAWTRECGSKCQPGAGDSGGAVYIPDGTCRIRLYDPSAGAAGYLAKVLNASEAWGWARSEIGLSKRAMLVAWREHRLGRARTALPVHNPPPDNAGHVPNIMP